MIQKERGRGAEGEGCGLSWDRGKWETGGG